MRHDRNKQAEHIHVSLEFFSFIWNIGLCYMQCKATYVTYVTFIDQELLKRFQYATERIQFTPASDLGYLAPPPGQFFMGAKLFIGTPWMGNEGVLKKNLVWAM